MNITGVSESPKQICLKGGNTAGVRAENRVETRFALTAGAGANLGIGRPRVGMSAVAGTPANHHSRFPLVFALIWIDLLVRLRRFIVFRIENVPTALLKADRVLSPAIVLKE